MPHTILGLPTINARTDGGAEVGRDRWTLSLQFTFLETVDSELMIVNQMGLLITYVRGDRAGRLAYRRLYAVAMVPFFRRREPRSGARVRAPPHREEARH